MVKVGDFMRLGKQLEVCIARTMLLDWPGLTGVRFWEWSPKLVYICFSFIRIYFIIIIIIIIIIIMLII